MPGRSSDDHDPVLDPVVSRFATQGAIHAALVPFFGEKANVGEHQGQPGCAARLARAALLTTLAWGMLGCESDSFVPPVNPELRGDVRHTRR